jgi:hypothetical protein
MFCLSLNSSSWFKCLLVGTKQGDRTVYVASLPYRLACLLRVSRGEKPIKAINHSGETHYACDSNCVKKNLERW